MSPTADAAFVSRLGASKLAVKLGVKLVVNPVVKLEVLLDDPDRQGHIANMAGRGCHSAAAPHTLVG